MILGSPSHTKIRICLHRVDKSQYTALDRHIFLHICYIPCLPPLERCHSMYQNRTSVIRNPNTAFVFCRLQSLQSSRNNHFVHYVRLSQNIWRLAVEVPRRLVSLSPFCPPGPRQLTSKIGPTIGISQEHSLYECTIEPYLFPPFYSSE